MRRNAIGWMLVGSLVAMGCGTASPPRVEQVSLDPNLTKPAGLIVLVDSCVQLDVVGEHDPFLIDESEATAKIVLSEVRMFLGGSGVNVRSEIVAVCAARTGAAGSSILVADESGAKARDAEPPIRVSGSEDKSAFAHAIGQISSFAMTSPVTSVSKEAALLRSLRESGSPATGEEESRSAMQMVRETMEASSLLYLAVRGTRISGGQKAGQFIESMVVSMASGMATTIATGGLVTVMVFPGRKIEGTALAAGLIDLDSMRLVANGFIRVRGDPTEDETYARVLPVMHLLDRIIFRAVDSSASGPGQSTRMDVP